MRTAVVILNWNTADYIEAFLPGVIESCAGLDADVVVADSGSDDNSRELLETKFPEVKVIPLGANYGFTGGYNRALSQLGKEYGYFVLLNSDIDVSPDWLEHLTEWMDSHPECAACGPKLHALVREGTSWQRTKRFEYAGAAGGMLTRHGFPWCRGRVLSRTSSDKGQYDGATPRVKWMSGACLMVRRSVWNEIGGFDDRFFAHMEEIDWCWRARRSGYRICVVPGSVVWHIGGGTLPATSPLKLKLNFRNSLLMLRNNAPARVPLRLAMDWCIALIYLITGRKENFSALKEAHKEYRNLKDK